MTEINRVLVCPFCKTVFKRKSNHRSHKCARMQAYERDILIPTMKGKLVITTKTGHHPIKHQPEIRVDYLVEPVPAET